MRPEFCGVSLCVLLSLQNPNPQSLSYLFSGYAPLSVKLVEVLSRKQGFSTFEEVCVCVCVCCCFLENKRNFKGRVGG